MRGEGRRWTWLIATGGVVTAFVAWAAVASAALSEHSKAATIPSLTDNTATASCPSGTEAVSGGFASPGLRPAVQRGVDHPLRLTSDRQRPVDGRREELRVAHQRHDVLLRLLRPTRARPRRGDEDDLDRIQRPTAARRPSARAEARRSPAGGRARRA